MGVLLPQTYMNDSGRSAGPARGALGVDLDRVVAVHDEIDLPFGAHRGPPRRRPGRPQRPEVAEAGAGQPRLPPHPRGRGAPGHHRSGDRLGPRAGPLPRARGRGAGAGGGRRRRARAADLLGAGRRIESRDEPRGAAGRPRAHAPLAPHIRPRDPRGRRPRGGRARGAAARVRVREPAARTCSPRCSTPSPTGPRSWWPATTARRATWPPTCSTLLAPAPGAPLPGPRRALRVAPGAAAAPGGPAHRRARRAAGRQAAPAVVVASRRGAGREGARPRAAPARLRDREGRAARPRGDGRPARGLRLRARRPGGGPRPVRHPRRHPRRLPGHRGARGALRAVRRRGRAAHLLLHLHPALARGGRARWRSPRPPSWRPSTASWPRSPRPPSEDERPDVAELLPVDRFGELLDLLPADALVAVAAEEELAPGAARPLGRRDHELPRRRRPPPLRAARPAERARSTERAALRLSSISGDQPHEFRAQSADTAARSLKEAEPELEKLVRSGYRTVVAWARRGEAERAALQPRPRPGRRSSTASPPRTSRAWRSPHASLREGFLVARAEAGDPARAPAAAPPPRRAPAGPRTAGGRRMASFTDLRAGVAGGARGPRHRALHRLRDQDGRRRHARLPGARVQGRRPRVRAQRPAAQDQPLRGRRRRRPAAVQARRQAVGADEARAPAARPRRWPAS